ncbi:MAG: SDR family oxidoreductase [Pseudomonadota bacterium]
MNPAEAPRVFITGASSGIGAALAREYASRGAILGLTARRPELLEQLARELNTSVAIYPLDVRDSAALHIAATDFTTRFGPTDIVIANAGVSSGTLTEEASDLAVFQEIFDINVMGMVNTFHPFITPMRERRTGTLVGIASIAGFRGLPGASAYSASKAAAISYLEGLRVELHGSGIAVTTICPGYIKTPMTVKNPYPMPFILDAEDAARRLIRAIDAKKSFATIPWQMALVGFFLKCLPNWFYDFAFSKAGRKPRRAPAVPTIPR